MKAQDIYHKMRAIADDHHTYIDQLTAIAMWIEAEFEYKPQNLANGDNTSKGQVATCPECGSRDCKTNNVKNLCNECWTIF